MDQRGATHGRIRAVIADDNESVRGGLRSLLETDRREEALAAGAGGVVLKDESAGMILAAVHGGTCRTALSPSIGPAGAGFKPPPGR